VDHSKYRYNHLGIPTTQVRAGETYLPAFKMYVSGYEENEFNIEWMRFEEGSSLPDIVQRLPHIAFEVDSLDEAIRGKEILIAPNSPSEGVKVAFILENGAPVEFLQFERKNASSKLGG
jgi:hypothetical protein